MSTTQPSGDLHQTVNVLAKQVRQLRMLVGLLFLCLVAVCCFQLGTVQPVSAAAPEKEITCERINTRFLSVTDEKGRTRVEASVSEKGSPYLSLHTPDGGTLATLIGGKDTSALVLMYPDGNRVELGAGRVSSYLTLGIREKGEDKYGMKLVDTPKGSLIALKRHQDEDKDDRIGIGLLGDQYDIRIRK